MARKHILLPMHIWNIKELSVTERLVASVIYGYTEQGKACFMTNTGLSKLLHVSQRTVSAAVNKLIDEGYVEALDDAKRRSLGWKNLLGGVEDISRGGRSQLLGGVEKSSIRNTDINTDSNTEHNMNDEILTRERKPDDWQQVRDYFVWVNNNQDTRYESHLQTWARDFFAYYEARSWKTKHGPITKWRGVALAWFKRSAERVPQRAMQKRDAEQIRSDIRWHEKRYALYDKQDKEEQAHRELRAIQRLQQELDATDARGAQA